MVKPLLKFSNSSLCFFKLLSYWTFMMVRFWGKRNKIFQTIVIFYPINMVNLPTLGSWAMGIFPDNNMFKHLMPDISSWMASERKENIPIAVFNSTTLPIWIFFTLLIFIMAFTTLLRVSIHPTTTIWANLLVSLGILIGITAPFSPLLFRYVRHEYIISGEIQLVNRLMRQKPRARN